MPWMTIRDRIKLLRLQHVQVARGHLLDARPHEVPLRVGRQVGDAPVVLVKNDGLDLLMQIERLGGLPIEP